MSEQELKDCEELLKNLLLPDNVIRKKAEDNLKQFLSSNENKEKLTLYCSLLLLKTSDLSVQAYCAIIIRKVFLPNENSDSS